MSDTTATQSKRERLATVVKKLLNDHGFTRVQHHTEGRMNFCDATSVSGAQVRFWVKKDWTGGLGHSAAISFGTVRGLTLGDPSPALLVEHVRRMVAKAVAAGAEYLLLVHVVDDELHTHYALPIDSVLEAYTVQLAQWPQRARNGDNAQLWFHQQAGRRDAECVRPVHTEAVSLAAISRSPELADEGSPAVKTVLAEVERRLQQEAFKNRLGERYGWRCAVSGNEVREVLDAAHLPGRDWRQHNTVEDGVLLRADLHRLLDSGLATLRDGKFCIEEMALCDQYVDFNGRPIR